MNNCDKQSNEPIYFQPTKIPKWFASSASPRMWRRLSRRSTPTDWNRPSLRRCSRSRRSNSVWPARAVHRRWTTMDRVAVAIRCPSPRCQAIPHRRICSGNGNSCRRRMHRRLLHWSICRRRWRWYPPNARRRHQRHRVQRHRHHKVKPHHRRHLEDRDPRERRPPPLQQLLPLSRRVSLVLGRRQRITMSRLHPRDPPATIDSIITISRSSNSSAISGKEISSSGISSRNSRPKTTTNTRRPRWRRLLIWVLLAAWADWISIAWPV